MPIELGTSLSSPLRLELAGNRTSSGHTVSQNRSRPEDHLTLAQRFVEYIVARRTVGGELPRREELERGILGPRSGGGAGQYRTLREPVRALPAFAPHDTRATAAGSGSCAICFHRGPAAPLRSPPLDPPREQPPVRQVDRRGCAAADLGSQAVRLLRTEHHRNLGTNRGDGTTPASSAAASRDARVVREPADSFVRPTVR